MKAFIVSADWDEIENKTLVQLFGRLENGQSFCTIHTVTPYFFIEKKNRAKLKGPELKADIEETTLKTFAEEPVIKISHPLQSELTKLAKYCAAKKIALFEADIKPHQRFIIDNDLKGSLDIQGSYDRSDRLDRLYVDPTITKAEYKPELNVLSIDIESDKDNDKLYCIGLYAKNYKNVFIISDKKLRNATACKDESDCLQRVKDKIIELDPDIITGWNIADFDFPYLRERYEKNGVSFDIGRTNETTHMRISKDFFRKSTISIPGRQVLDGLALLKDPFIKEAPSVKYIDIETWTLENVSQAILGEGKLIKGKNRHLEIERLFKEKEHQALVDYNLQDCKLAYDILEKTKTLELAIERTQLTGLTFDRLTASIAAFDSLYIREARKKGFVSPSTEYTSKEERIRGGYVMNPKPGIYHDVLVLDFKSLYPSIIKTFNIDPASHLKEKEKGAVVAPNGAAFKNQEGILPGIITELHAAREKAKKEKREFSSYAIKIIMNSFFGVLASPNCRYFSLDMANAITHFAQFIIKLTAQKIEERGYSVIYSDTDSVFINAEGKKTNPADLQKHINEFYNEFVKKEYARISYLDIEFKRHYLSFLLPPIRNTKEGEEKGSKKRYAGLYKKENKEELEIIGLEAIRGDWTDAAQDFQKELLLKIFHREECVPFIKTYVKKIQEGKLDNKLVYRKSIRKELEEYVKTTPPHVKAARKLDKLEGNLIEYYMTEDGPEPLQKLKHKIDYGHYIEKQIKPIANAILFFFNLTFDDILKESKQTKLFA
ncbi:MAG: DNA polymerase II [Nanoarchaeota archaeon]